VVCRWFCCLCLCGIVFIVLWNEIVPWCLLFVSVWNCLYGSVKRNSPVMFRNVSATRDARWSFQLWNFRRFKKILKLRFKLISYISLYCTVSVSTASHLLLLEVGPLIRLGGLEECLSSPGGVWGDHSLRIWHLVATIWMILVRINIGG